MAGHLMAGVLLIAGGGLFVTLGVAALRSASWIVADHDRAVRSWKRVPALGKLYEVTMTERSYRWVTAVWALAMGAILLFLGVASLVTI